MTGIAPLGAQPWLGLGGLLLAAVVFFALALGTGSTATWLLILGPISTFALAAVAMIAFWWNDWPGSRLTTPWTGLIDTVLVAAIGVALTIAGAGGRRAPRYRARVFEAAPVPRPPATFPATSRWPGPPSPSCSSCRWSASAGHWAGSGGSGQASPRSSLSWAIGVGAYFLFVNVSYLPAAERAAAGLRDPGGPVTRADFGAALIAVGVWQAVIYIALRGWPVNTITRRSRRLLVGNALVIGLGAGTYALLRDGAFLSPGTIGAACGCVISAALVVALLFEGWPARRLRPAAPAGSSLSASPPWSRSCSTGGLAAYADGAGWIRAASGRLGDRRVAQLRRRRDHPARRHRTPLALRSEDQGELGDSATGEELAPNQSGRVGLHFQVVGGRWA